MSKIIPLISFGMGLIGIGAFWTTFDECRVFFRNIIVYDEYHTLMEFGFDVMPIIAIIMGIFCLISAGVMARTKYQTEVV